MSSSDWNLVPDTRATRFGGTVAVLVAVGAGLALGVADGSLGATAAAIVGGLLAALGVRATQSETNARRAVGSVGVVAGASAFAATGLLGGGPVALVVGAAVAAAAVNATVSFDARVQRPASEAVRRSATVLAVGAVLALGVATGAFVASAEFVGAGLVAVASANGLALLVALQVEILLLAELLHLAVPILDRWLPEEREIRAATLGRFDFRIEDAPWGYWVAFVVQVSLALTSWGPRWFAALLDATSVFGRAVALLLFSGVLHLPLAALVLGLVGVLLARGLQVVFVGWAGADPPRAVAAATGGIATVAVAALLALALPGTADALASLGTEDWARTVHAVGPTAVVAGAVSATLFAVATARQILGPAVAPWVVTNAAGGFTVAGAGLVVAALVVASNDGSALAAFAGVAAGLVVHDLGSNAVELGAQVGSEAETRAGEAAHAVGSLLVGSAGVALATLTAFVMGSASFSPAAWRARLAVALLLVAVLCFAVLFERG